MNPLPSEELSVTRVREAIVEACQQHNKNLDSESLRRGHRSRILRLGNANDLSSIVELLKNEKDEGDRHCYDQTKLIRDFDLIYWIVVEENGEIVSFATAYWGYSTWDGRCLHVNKMVVVDEDIEVTLLRTLAIVAVHLDGQRLVWQHFNDKTHLYRRLGAQVLDDWISLRMNMNGMDSFLQDLKMMTTPEVATNGKGRIESLMPLSVDASITEALDLVRSKNVELHLATMANLDHIERLVHGLAVYEKDVEAIHVNKEHYQVDGGFGKGKAPLYKCLLLWDENRHHHCGIAFFYFGYDIDRGRFLYLEDLFIEEYFRGNGCGSLIMAALALIAKRTGSSNFIWQALNWNTPALNFYRKIGATTLDGLLSSRFCGEALKEFAQNGSHSV